MATLLTLIGFGRLPEPDNDTNETPARVIIFRASALCEASVPALFFVRNGTGRSGTGWWITHTIADPER
jgi:hypothetical protein